MSKESFELPNLAEAELSLESHFPPHTADQWRKAAEALLKGVPFEKALQTRLYEDLTLDPLYGEETHPLPSAGLELPAQGQRRRGASASGYLGKPWRVSQELPLSTPREANEVLLIDLARGQDEIHLLLDVATLSGKDPDEAEVGEVGACGISLASQEDMEELLEGVRPEAVSFFLRSGYSGLPVAALLASYLNKHGIPLAQLRGAVENDPLGVVLWQGECPLSLESLLDEMAILTKWAIGHAPLLQTITISGQNYHDSGASATEELGYALATLIAYLRAMDERGIPPAEVLPRMRLCLSVGSNFFLEIAKFRAARQLLHKVALSVGATGNASPVHIHARTSLWNKTRLDPYVNLLRTTTEGFAAVMGGCDSLHIGPFDECIRVPDSFSRRLARNLHTILREECDLFRVLDPAGGSWYVESLTEQLAAKSWEIMQSMEKAGGMPAALQQGVPQGKVQATCSKRIDNIKKRRDSIVGTNNYANIDESPLPPMHPDYAHLKKERSQTVANRRTGGGTHHHEAILRLLQNVMESKPQEKMDSLIEALNRGATLGEATKALRAHSGKAWCMPKLTPQRASVPFEILRQACRQAAAHGPAPSILQLNMGPTRRYRARADWTTGFFGVGGLRVQNQEEYTNPEEAISAVRIHGPLAAILTGTDDTYLGEAEKWATEIRAACPDLLLFMAGAPGEKEADYRKAGIHDFIHVRVPAHSFIEKLLHKTGILS